MDNGSLKHEASTRQLHSSRSDLSKESSTKSDVFCDTLQAMHFSLTFAASQWCLFWRLLNVGCMLADELLDLLANPTKTTTPDAAMLWNELSTELAALLKNDAVRIRREKAETTV